MSPQARPLQLSSISNFLPHFMGLIVALVLLCPTPSLANGPKDLVWVGQVKSLLEPYSQTVEINPDGWLTIQPKNTKTTRRYLIAKPDAKLEVEELDWLSPPDEHGLSSILETNDGYLFVEIAELSNGRPALPIIRQLPFSYKTKSFIQTAVLPDNLFIPGPWKSLMGNLLTQTTQAQQAQLDPLILTNDSQQQLMLWQLKEGMPSTSLALNCKPSSVVHTQSTQTLWVGCADKPELLGINLKTGQQQTIALEAPVDQLWIDTSSHYVWVHHPSGFVPTVLPTAEEDEKATDKKSETASEKTSKSDKKKDSKEEETPELSSELRNVTIFKAQDNQLVLRGYGDIPPMQQLIISGFRRQVFGLATIEKKPLLLIYSVLTGDIVKEIELPYPIDYIQLHQEKMLWIANRDKKKLIGIDVRWQEATPEINLETRPLALISINKDFLVLDTEGTFHVVDPKTLKLISIGTLPALDLPVIDFTLLPFENRRALLVIPKPNLQQRVYEIDLDQAKPQTYKLQSAQANSVDSEVTIHGWFKSQPESAQSQATIRFQDGRLLIQSLPQLQ